jgi:hypothetical protein
MLAVTGRKRCEMAWARTARSSGPATDLIGS